MSNYFIKYEPWSRRYKKYEVIKSGDKFAIQVKRSWSRKYILDSSTLGKFHDTEDEAVSVLKSLGKKYAKRYKIEWENKEGRVAKGNMKGKKAAAWLIPKLKSEGYIVQRYDAVKTKSIYLKLDYGVANSIRISDHKGYKYLSYRYNIECWQECGRRYGKDRKGFDKFYYASCKNDLEQLLEDIKAYKEDKLNRYGEEKYKEYMQQNIEKGKEAKEHTFWHKAKEV